MIYYCLIFPWYLVHLKLLFFFFGWIGDPPCGILYRCIMTLLGFMWGKRNILDFWKGRISTWWDSVISSLGFVFGSLHGVVDVSIPSGNPSYWAQKAKLEFLGPRVFHKHSQGCSIFNGFMVERWMPTKHVCFVSGSSLQYIRFLIACIHVLQWKIQGDIT